MWTWLYSIKLILTGCDFVIITFHIMDTPSAIYRVHQCSDCQGDTAYYCVSCQFDLCPRCKEKHEKGLKTMDHNVMTYRKNIKNIPTQEICQRHSTMLYEMYCEHCELPVCYHCIQHRTHRWMDIQRAIPKTNWYYQIRCSLLYTCSPDRNQSW